MLALLPATEELLRIVEAVCHEQRDRNVAFGHPSLRAPAQAIRRFARSVTDKAAVAREVCVLMFRAIDQDAPLVAKLLLYAFTELRNAGDARDRSVGPMVTAPQLRKAALIGGLQPAPVDRTTFGKKKH